MAEGDAVVAGCQGWPWCAELLGGAGSRPRTPGWRRGMKTGGLGTCAYEEISA